MGPTDAFRRRSDAGCVVLFRKPDHRLREFVSSYCGYLEWGLGPTRRLELPSATVGLILGLGPPVEIVRPRRQDTSPVQVSSFLAGLHDSSAVATSTGWQYGLQVDLSPIGARMLFGVPMHELANRAVDLNEVLGRSAGRVAERLRDMPTWAERFRFVDALLTRRLQLAHPVSADIVWAWARLDQSGGRLNIGALAEELGTSRQHLVTRFRQEVGLPPKSIGRILRFQRAVHLLHQDCRPNFAAIAQRCGYYDQPHFNRDFVDLAGISPTDYLSRRLVDGAGVLAAAGETAGQ